MPHHKGQIASICILTSVHPALSSRIFYKQARSLVRAGYDVTLIAQHAKDEIIGDVRIIALPQSPSGLRRILSALGVFRVARKQKADMYHFHDPELIIIGMMLKMFTKGKVIYDVHEDYPKAILLKAWLPAFTRKLMSKAFDIFEKFVSMYFDYVVTATGNIEKNFGSSRVTAVKNYPILDFDMKRLERSNIHKNNTCTLIYAGGITQKRGIKEIVQSLEFLGSGQKVTLKLMGRFSGKKFEKEIRNLREFKNKVEFLGWQPMDEVYKNLIQADIGLVCLHPLPRYKVSLPIKLFEYMSMGLPVIASNFPLWKEIIEKNECGLTVDPLQSAEIAKAVKYLLENPAERERMSKNAKIAFLERYNWGREEKKLLSIYEKLLDADTT